jgi:hypothetical protein
MGYRGMKGETMKSERIAKARKRAWMSWTLVTLFFIGIPPVVHADVSDILLNFHPYITAQEEYSTNILLSPNAYKLDDWITTVIPGLRFSKLQAGGYGIDLDVAGGYTYYAKNHDFSYWSPTGRLDTWYAMTPKLTFRVRDFLIRSDAAREERYDNLYNAEGQYIGGTEPDQYLLSTQRGVHAIYIRNVVEPSIVYRFGRENLASLLYRNNIYRNNNPLYEDSTENTINPILNYWLDIRNGVTLDFSYTSGYFETSPNMKGLESRGRYTHRFDPRLSLFGEYSFIREHFENPGVDYDVHNPSMGIEYKFSPTLTATLQGGYFWESAQDDTRSRGPFFHVSLVQTGRKTSYTLIGEGGYNRDYFTAQNLGFSKYYKAYGTINHQFTQRMSVRATGSMERPMYSNGQKDWIWEGRITASYLLFRWLSIALEGVHREDRSNVEGGGYSEYSGIFRITATYN